MYRSPGKYLSQPGMGTHGTSTQVRDTAIRRGFCNLVCARFLIRLARLSGRSPRFSIFPFGSKSENSIHRAPTVFGQAVKTGSRIQSLCAGNQKPIRPILAAMTTRIHVNPGRNDIGRLQRFAVGDAPDNLKSRFLGTPRARSTARYTKISIDRNRPLGEEANRSKKRRKIPGVSRKPRPAANQ